jgi:hypothetical protein
VTKRKFIYLLLLGLLTVAGCVPSSTGSDEALSERYIEPFAQILEERGVQVEAAQNTRLKNVFDEIFEQDTSDVWTVTANGEEIRLYVFDDIPSTQQAAEAISPDAQTFTGPNNVIMIDYVVDTPPRYWQHDNYIIFYSGNVQATLAMLDATFGERIAQAPGRKLNLALLHDAQAYADDYGIDVEEAIQRLNMQEAIGELGARLGSEERDTFAGLWVEHEPLYRVVIAFTRDGEATLAPYVTGSSLADIVEVRTAAVTYEELQAIQSETNQLLEPLSMSFSSGINIQENLVELYVTDLAAFDAGIQAHDIQLPEHLNIVTIYEPLGNDLPFEVIPDDSIYFPQLKTRSTSFMEALLIGRLEVENGCLLAYQEGSDQPITIVWQTDYFLHNNEGSIEMLDREGKVVGAVGEMIYLGGGEVGNINSDQLQAPIPERCSSSPLWLMGEFLPEEYIPNVTGESE